MSVKLPKGAMGSVKEHHGGIRIAHHKNTSRKESTVLPCPSKVRIPLNMHIGSQCHAVVKVKDEVKVGQLIADSDDKKTSPIYSSISGTVKSIREGDVTHSGVKTTVIEIESDGLMSECEDLKIPEINSSEDFIQALRASGVVGLGGAGFPTYFKSQSAMEANADTLILNGAECEPYITVDEYAMLHRTEDILEGAMLTMKWLNMPKTIIGIEDNKPEAIQAFLDVISANSEKYKNIEVLVTESSYPRGAEKVLIYNATGREVPIGKLPMDVQCLVLNVTTMAEVVKFIKTGKPLTSRLLTIDGSAVKSPQNILTPIGTAISDVLDFVGLVEEPKMVIMGGPMMGVAVSNFERSIIKQNNAILALTDEDIVLSQETECIRCSRCIDACPVSLQPTSLMKAIKYGNIEKAESLNLKQCIECGSCDYVCPSRIPLVQYFRHGKKLLWEKGGKKNG